jgi:hypothetical protein
MVILQTQKTLAYGWNRVVTPTFLGTDQFVENKMLSVYNCSHLSRYPGSKTGKRVAV